MKKKNLNSKLVSAYILALLVFLLSGFNSTQAQTWTLQQCLDTAYAHNRNLKIGRNTISISKEKNKEAKANLIPKINGYGDYKYYTDLPYQLMPLTTFNPAAEKGDFKETQFGVPHNINATLQLSVPLYNPQLYGAIEASKIGSELSQLQYLKTEEDVYFEITNIYYNAQVIYHQLAFIDSNLVNTQKLLKNMKLLNEQLLAKGSDVTKVKLQLEQLSTQHNSINSKYKQTINLLKFSMGIPMTELIEIEKDIQYPNSVDYTPLPTLDVRSLSQQNRFLSSELSTLNKSRFLPSINLTGTYGTMGFGYDEKPKEFLNFHPIGYAGLQLSYPLFGGTVIKRKMNQKRIEIQNNQLRYDLSVEKTQIEVENAKMKRMVAKSSVENTNEQINLAQKVFAQTVLQQRQGIATLTDVLLADHDLREAQQTYLNYVVDYLKSDLELKKLTGNLKTNK